MPDISAITLTASYEADQLKLSWRFAYPDVIDDDYVYTVNAGPLLAMAQDVRRCLDQMSQLCGRAEMAGQQCDRGAFLPDLFEAGVKLRKLLLPPSQREAVEASALLASTTFDVPLMVRCTGPVHIPWGFLTRRAHTLPIATDYDPSKDFSEFWGLYFNLSVQFQAISKRNRTIIRSENFRLLGLMTEHEFDSAMAAVPDEAERRELETIAARLFSLQLGKVFDWRCAQRGWADIVGSPSAFYIFGHCDGTAIYLRDGDSEASQSVHDFKASFVEIDNDSRPPRILFINGCRSAAGTTTLSFLQDSWGYAFRGCIATEAEVPNAFALRYGLRFMDRLCFGGKTLGEVFRGLRADRRLFPLSLLYGCYADPTFRVEQEPPDSVDRAA